MEEENIPRLLKDRQCPECDRNSVIYLGMESVHGKIFTPSSDTEEEHQFICESCGYKWTTHDF